MRQAYRQTLERGDHRRGPCSRVDALVPLFDFPVRGDDHADALRTLRRVDVGAVGRADLAVRVADQREGEVELLGELLVVLGRVERDAQDHRVLPVVVGLQVAEPATFGGSAGCVGLGEEPEHDRLALEVGQLDRLAVVVAPDEVRRLVACTQHRDPPLVVRLPRYPMPTPGQRARTISAANASSASQSYGPSRTAMLSRAQPSARNWSTIARASFTGPRR